MLAALNKANQQATLIANVYDGIVIPYDISELNKQQFKHVQVPKFKSTTSHVIATEKELYNLIRLGLDTHSIVNVACKACHRPNTTPANIDNMILKESLERGVYPGFEL